MYVRVCMYAWCMHACDVHACDEMCVCVCVCARVLVGQVGRKIPFLYNKNLFGLI